MTAVVLAPRAARPGPKRRGTRYLLGVKEWSTVSGVSGSSLFGGHTAIKAIVVTVVISKMLDSLQRAKGC